MSESKSLFHRLAETYDDYRAERRAAAGLAPAPRPNRLGRFLRWLAPNGGTILVVLALLLTQQVWARPAQNALNVPGPSATTVNYQGRLADPAGNPLDGNYGMTFSLWDAPSGGALVWGPENHPAVPVSGGLFSVGLGSLTSGGIPTTVWNGDRYLEIIVGGETLSPRELIRSVPIAGMALTVPDGSISTAKIVNGAVSREKIGADVNLVLVQSGKVYADVTTPGWTLHQGTGVRTYTANITYGKSFKTIPAVQVSLYGADTYHGAGFRLNVHPQNITEDGFQLVFCTYADSIVYGAGATWIAIGSE